MSRYLTCLSILFLFAIIGQSQGFRAAGVAGLNLSQIDGDGSAGYNKWGLTGGARVMYEVYPKMDIAIELLYSQRGSRNPDEFDPFTINLDYLEIPIVYTLKDWYKEEGYYKARLDVGLSYGQLFRSSESVGGFVEDLNSIRDSDVSWLAGVGYQFTAHWGIGLRYTRSITRLYKNAAINTGGLRGYFITVRSEYHF